jgi:hypothetical protein
VIENLLKLGGGFGILVRGQLRHPAHANGIQASEERVEVDCRVGELVGARDLQLIDRG